MLQYFIEKESIQDIENICAAINRIKRQIKTGDFSTPYKEYDF